jgi:hypothetical protein
MQRLSLFFILATSTGSHAWRTDMAWLKETEKKHSRVALLALPALFALKGTGVEEPISYLSQQPLGTQIDFFSLSAILEAGVSLPRFQNFFDLKEGLVPGNVLGAENVPKSLDNAETGLGRMAMICTFVWLITSLV